MTRHPRLLLLLVPLLLAVSAVLVQPAADPSPPSAPRIFRSLGDARWRLSLADIGIESMPLALAATKDHVIIVAPDRSVVAVRRATRRISWRASREKLGLTPRIVLPRDSATVMILGEPGDSPIAVRVSSGATRMRWPSTSTRLLYSGCFVRDFGIVSSVDSGPPLLVYDSTGRFLRHRSLPWPEYHASHPLLRQILLSPSPDDTRNHCVGALALGDGLAAIDDRQVLWTAQYRERVRPPEVRVRTARRPDGSVVTESQLAQRITAARELATGDGIVYVAFGGATPLAGQIIDMYALDSGRYLGTLRFDQTVRRLAVDGQRLYVAAYDGGHPVILGYDVTRTW